MKFKVGDLVKCVNTNTVIHGCGWKKDYEFKITSISSGNSPVYWGGYKGAGVYEYEIKLVNKEIKKYGIALFLESIERR